MSQLSNWEIMIMLIVILLVIVVVSVVLCRQQNMYHDWCINICRNFMRKTTTPSPAASRRSITTGTPILTNRTGKMERTGSKADYESIQDATPGTARKVVIPVIVSTASADQIAEGKAQVTNSQQNEEGGSQDLLELPDQQLKRTNSWISLTAIEGEYDLNSTANITHLKRTYSSISIDDNSALLPILPDPLSSCISAMIEVSLFFDAIRGYLNIGIAYAYGLNRDDLKLFSECYVRLIVTEMVPPPATPARSQYRTTKVVKTSEVMEILQKFRFDLPKIDSTSPVQYELAKLQIELNAYGRARSHKTVAKREMVLDSNMLPNGEPRIVMVHLYQPNIREIWEPPTIGEILVSLCFQPATSKLTMILLQIKKLQLSSSSDQEAAGNLQGSSNEASEDRRRGSRHHRHRHHHRDASIRGIGGSAYLVIDGKMTSRKKLKEVTVYEEQTDKLDINEVVFFQLDKVAIQTAELRVLIEKVSEDGNRSLVGFFYIGNSTSGNGLLHWKYIMGNTRKPYVLWHQLVKYPLEQPPQATDDSNNQTMPINSAEVEFVSEVSAAESSSTQQDQQPTGAPSSSSNNSSKRESVTKIDSRKFSQIKPFEI